VLIEGPLISQHVAAHVLATELRGRLGEDLAEGARRRMKSLWRRVTATLGPASGARAVHDVAVEPLLRLLGYVVGDLEPTDGGLTGSARGPTSRLGLVSLPWAARMDAAWRPAVRHGLAIGARWSIVANGPRLRVVDVDRSFGRRYAEFDLDAAERDPAVFALLWGLLRASAFDRDPRGARTAGHRVDRSVLADAVALSARHGGSVCRSLHLGVRDAIDELTSAFGGSRRPLPHDEVASQSLAVVYRVLFLLFAEARALVPIWHPVFRASYSIEALVESLESRERPPIALWDSLQAICRLARVGCRFEDLTVNAFNGQLFAAAAASLTDRVNLSDDVTGRVLRSLTSRPRPGGRERITYADLGVEELGSVYERVLDHVGAASKVESPTAPGQRGRAARSARKETGTFYTPRTVTDFLVRRTLSPLVEGCSSGVIAGLRVVDPAMGSGAFLVSACRFLADAYERALVSEGQIGPNEVGERERAGFRRLLAQRCLYGVDATPMAVQLARLSLWLATLAADRPLSFLDHHLRAGNSLIGAAPSDLVRRPPGTGRSARGGPGAQLPLFDAATLDAAVRTTLATMTRLATEPDDTPEDVREKERTLEALLAPDAPLARWKAAVDFWCASWLDGHRRLTPALAASIVGLALGRDVDLPRDAGRAWLDRARDLTTKWRFFHWTLEFPVRDAGVYAGGRDAHANLYQLFVERALHLVRPGGRVGLVVPWGFAVDHGCGQLRQRLFESCAVDTLTSFENQHGIFPIHASVRFLLFTATTGASTDSIRCTLGLRDPTELERQPDAGASADNRAGVRITLTLLRKVSGERLIVPDVRTPADVRFLDHLCAAAPSLGEERGWGVRFGRELNLTDDRAWLRPRTHATGRGEPITVAGAYPVVEGKHLHPFTVDLTGVRHVLVLPESLGLPPRLRNIRSRRLAYRDVASATNRLSLIAAIVPAGVATAHTLFCLRDALDEADQRFLCGMLNSFVANAFVRLQMTTHVTTALVARLPVPRPCRGSRGYVEVASLARALESGSGNDGDYARLQAIVAHLYGLDAALFGHLLDGFPLVERSTRDRALSAFHDITSSTMPRPG
jgi:N-6 DNA Methylase